MMLWRISYRADPVACVIADRHYNRQKPGTPQFVPPGRCMVLLNEDATALWVTSWPLAEYVKHRWPGAWINSCFRREAGAQASDLIRDAIGATRWFYGDPPVLGIVTFIGPDKIRPRRAGYGKCYLRAGFEPDGETKGGLLAFRMKPDRMPEPEQPYGSELFMSSMHPMTPARNSMAGINSSATSSTLAAERDEAPNQNEVGGIS